MNAWSNELIAKTRLELEDLITYTDSEGKQHWLMGSMDLDKGAHFKNSDGDRFGIMAVEDACNGNFIISIKESNENESFKTIDALIHAGWVLD